MSNEETPTEFPKIEELDLLRAENIHLKVLLQAYKKKDAAEGVRRIDEELDALNQRVVEIHAELGKKYNINFQTHEIRQGDGAIVPRGTAGLVGLNQLIAQMAAKKSNTG